jgi:hypothetical protein
LGSGASTKKVKGATNDPHIMFHNQQLGMKAHVQITKFMAIILQERHFLYLV